MSNHLICIRNKSTRTVLVRYVALTEMCELCDDWAESQSHNPSGTRLWIPESFWSALEWLQWILRVS
jgi:hypothetical protein